MDTLKLKRVYEYNEDITSIWINNVYLCDIQNKNGMIYFDKTVVNINVLNNVIFQYKILVKNNEMGIKTVQI